MSGAGTNETDDTSLSLRTVAPADFHIISEMFAETNPNDDFGRILFGKGNNHSRIARFYRRAIRHKQNSGIIAEVNREVVGALVYTDFPACEPTKPCNIPMFFDLILLMKHRIIFFQSLSKEVLKAHPKWPHRHVVMAGVRHEIKDRAATEALYRQFCDLADAASVGSYIAVASEASKELSEQFGFRETSRISRGGLTVIGMWRQPANCEFDRVRPEESIEAIVQVIREFVKNQVNAEKFVTEFIELRRSLIDSSPSKEITRNHVLLEQMSSAISDFEPNSEIYDPDQSDINEHTLKRVATAVLVLLTGGGYSPTAPNPRVEPYEDA